MGLAYRLPDLFGRLNIFYDLVNHTPLRFTDINNILE